MQSTDDKNFQLITLKLAAKLIELRVSWSQYHCNFQEYTVVMVTIHRSTISILVVLPDLKNLVGHLELCNLTSENVLKINTSLWLVVNTAPADGLAPLGARPLAGTVLTKNWHLKGWLVGCSKFALIIKEGFSSRSYQPSTQDVLGCIYQWYSTYIDKKLDKCWWKQMEKKIWLLHHDQPSNCLFHAERFLLRFQMRDVK